MKNRILFFMIGLLCVSVLSCEKIADEDHSTVSNPDEASIVFHVTLYSQAPLSVGPHRVKVNAKDVCSRISYAIFKEGEKVKAVNQVVGDESFGTLSLTLPLGNYQFVVTAHNGLGNASIVSPEKITFSNNKCTDTFCAFQDFSVTEDTSMDVTLNRVVAKVRFVVEDPIPSDVSQMKFYYTGGSSTLDAVSGYGCVNSKQTEYRNITDEMRQDGGTFDLYTFPHKDKDTIKLTVTALTVDEDNVKERTFSEVPIVMNSVTQYSGAFFDSSDSEEDLELHFQVDTTWVQYAKFYY